jgi:hypothetical protein
MRLRCAAAAVDSRSTNRAGSNRRALGFGFDPARVLFNISAHLASNGLARPEASRTKHGRARF